MGEGGREDAPVGEEGWRQGSGVRGQGWISDGCHKPMQPGLPWRLSGEKLPFKQRQTWVQSLGWEDPLEKEVATRPSTLAWRIPLDRGAWWATVHGSQSGTRLGG